jgi:hypothetical protein
MDYNDVATLHSSVNVKQTVLNGCDSWLCSQAIEKLHGYEALLIFLLLILHATNSSGFGSE